MSSLALVPQRTLVELANLAIAALPSYETRRSYRGYIREFLVFSAGRPLTRELVANFMISKRDAGAGTSGVIQSIKAVRVLVKEAKLRNLLSDTDFAGIMTLVAPQQRGVRSGNWLQLADVQALLQLPSRKYPQGLRNAIILGLLVGCGLRRGEIARLEWSRYQQREGRWCLVDIKGKGDKLRTVAVPDWLARDMNRWGKYYTRTPTIVRIGAMQIRNVVGKYMRKLMALPGHEHCRDMANVAPHDLRRTLAKLMDKAGVPLPQISATLGHSSLVVTQRYLGTSIELRPGLAGVDHVNLIPNSGQLTERSESESWVDTPDDTPHRSTRTSSELLKATAD